MTVSVALTLLVLGFCVLVLARGRVATDVTLVGGLVLLVLLGELARLARGGLAWAGRDVPAWLADFRTVDVEGALSGLANPGLAAVGVLFAVAEGLRQTGAVEYAGRRMLGSPKNIPAAVLRVGVPAAVVSAVLNNTPVVLAALPVVSDWAKRHGISPSKVLIPLSFAAVLGGMCSLIGTSTLLVLDGELRKLPGQTGLGLFEVAWVGVPAALVGLPLLALLAGRVLPDRAPGSAALGDPREYTVEMLLAADSPLVGQSVEAAGLRNLPGAYLLEIVRGRRGPVDSRLSPEEESLASYMGVGVTHGVNGTGRVVAAVGPNERLRAGDRLVFVGAVESVKDLRRLPGLSPATDQAFKLAGTGGDAAGRQLVEAVVSDGYPFLGATVRDSRFRSHYNAAIIAVARGGARVPGRIGDIRLQPGDTLLLEAPPGFVKLRRYSKHFFLVSGVEDSAPPRFARAWTARAILLGMVLAMAGGVPPAVAAATACGLMLFGRCLKPSEARRSVDWAVLLTIAAGLGLGKALEGSGAAAWLADTLTGLAGNNPRGQLAALFVLTAVLANLITAKAAGVLVFSVAVAVAGRLGLDPVPFVLSVMAAAAGVFAGPVGFQTHLLVMGPGGYKPADYLRLGVPLTLVVFACAMVMIPAVWGFAPAG